jgi:hypothetical protein
MIRCLKIYFNMIFDKNRFALFIVLISFLALPSCKPDEEEPNGPAVNPDLLTGLWTCTESSQMAGAAVYEVEIIKSGSSANQLLIEGIYHLGAGNTGVLNMNGNNIIIPQQVVNNVVIAGNGVVVNQNRINLEFTADDGGGMVDAVSAYLTR